MKFLDQINALEAKALEIAEQVAALLQAKDDLSNTMGDAARQVAALQQAIADAPKAFSIDISHNGQDFTVSEKDGLVLLAALVRALENEEVPVRLASGQTPQLRITDLEQVASLILAEAAK